ncbi:MULTISPECIES: glycerophosphodiester phosphodiesterase family protein [Luteimonas]|uniref:glycerophosphodiester phosphodiesterase family protein n=1 Tax=Luteimonas TaxID=83614 RepID=UPI001E4A567F|nr:MULTISPECIES: glycerophosphodiester phosphodiesterase family protein [Luteimonas]
MTSLPGPTLHAATPQTATRPLVIAHRGASARLPEHTLAAYRRAIDDGADVIEPDLVMTRDGVLVARHENEIGGTTDVARRVEFAGHRRTQPIDGSPVTGWFTEDFTLAELRSLRAREPLPDVRSVAHDGAYAVPTFDEILALLADAAADGRVVGLMPELKHPTHFRALDLAMEAPLLAALAGHAAAGGGAVVVQSFEPTALRELRAQLAPRHGDVELLQLIGGADTQPADVAARGEALRYRDMTTPDGLRAIAGYAQWLGPHKSAIARFADDDRPHATTLVADAHAAGLRIAPYTFRPENPYLPAALREGRADARHEAGAIAEMRAYLALGIDGLFTDDPALGRRAVDGDAVP